MLEAILAALTIGLPIVLTGAIALVRQWLRLREAKLRAERLQLPPSTEPPPPHEPWYSLRPRRQRKRGSHK